MTISPASYKHTSTHTQISQIELQQFVAALQWLKVFHIDKPLNEFLGALIFCTEFHSGHTKGFLGCRSFKVYFYKIANIPSYLYFHPPNLSRQASEAHESRNGIEMIIKVKGQARSSKGFQYKGRIQMKRNPERVGKVLRHYPAPRSSFVRPADTTISWTKNGMFWSHILCWIWNK